MTWHYTNAELLAYLDENTDVVDVRAVATHLDECTRCAGRLRDLQEFGALMREAATWVANDGDGESADSALARFARDAERLVGDSVAADQAFAGLLARPIDTWKAFLAANPQLWTEGLVRRLIEAAIRELDRGPAHALALLGHAETVASALRGDAAEDRKSVV